MHPYLQSRRESMMPTATGAPISGTQAAEAVARNGPAESGNASQSEAALSGSFPTSVVFAVISDDLPLFAARCRKG